MKLSQLGLMVCVVVAGVGCRSMPLDTNLQANELVASAGVMAYFTDPNVDRLEASSNITCKRHRRVGTHLISKICMTNDEWRLQEEDTRDAHMDHRTNLPCLPGVTGAYMDSSVVGALIPTSCGETLNRGN